MNTPYSRAMEWISGAVENGANPILTVQPNGNRGIYLTCVPEMPEPVCYLEKEVSALVLDLLKEMGRYIDFRELKAA